MTTRRPHLALIGMPGVGKTTLARALAAALDRPWCDLDAVIEEREGRAVADIFAADGEPGFRDAEARALAAVLDAETPTVVATGGGVVTTPANVAALRHRARCVWVHRSLASLSEELPRSGVSRPLVDGLDPDGLRRRLESLWAEREPLYRSLAEIEVAVDGIDVDAATALILENLRALGPDGAVAS